MKKSDQKDRDISDVVLDPSPLLAMFEDDHEQVREILGDFIRPASNTINEILQAHMGGDISRIEMNSHKLKSSARSVGAFRLGDICEQLEKASKNNDREVLERLAPELESLLESIIEQIRKFREEKPL